MPLQWALVCVMSCLTVGCRQTFIVAAKPTHDFPMTWSDMNNKVRVTQTKAQTSAQKVKEPPYVQASQARPKPSPPPPVFTGEIERVAVLEIHNKVPTLVSMDEVSYLTNELRSVASYLPSSKYLVLTKESLEVLIDPTTPLEECVGSCAVETGRLVGARWILTGEVVRFGKSLRVSLKVHNTQTGQFLKGISIKGSSAEELESQLHREALILVKEISPRWGKWLHQVASGDLTAQLLYLRNTTRDTQAKTP